MEVISNLEVDVDFYRLAHLDLQHLTDEQLVEHYIIYGKNEGRTPNNVDVDFYRNNHPDLQHLTDKQLVHHYIEYGKKEGRLPNKQVDDDSIRCVKICMISEDKVGSTGVYLTNCKKNRTINVPANIYKKRSGTSSITSYSIA